MKTIKTLFLLLAPFFAVSQIKEAVKSSAAKEVIPAAGTEIIRGPYLQVATPTGITIRWRTDVYDRSRVRYGLQRDNLDKHTDDSTLVSEHEIKLTGLKPNTKYYYQIGNLSNSTIKGDEDNYFYTLPETGKPGFYRIAAFGDCGRNNLNQRDVRDQMLKYLGKNELTSWILLGDNAYTRGTDAEYQAKFFNIYKDKMLKNFPLFPAPGNHDYLDISFSSATDQHRVAYFQNFSVPTKGESGGLPSNNKAFYAFDIGNVHFLSLDSYGKDNNGKRLFEEGEQLAWIKKDLKANTNKQWVVAFFHHPPYTMGSHDSDKETELVKIREDFIKVLENEGVDLVLCGHSHVYERTKMIKGYYGMEADFDANKHNLSQSSALYDGSKNSAPYLKSIAKNSGTVYVVSGSAGALGGHKEKYPHNAMFYSNNEVGGALIMEVDGNKLDVKWICADGKIRDHFTMMKDVEKADEKILLKDKILKRDMK
jgi:hypothetical protein